MNMTQFGFAHICNHPERCPGSFYPVFIMCNCAFTLNIERSLHLYLAKTDQYISICWLYRRCKAEPVFVALGSCLCPIKDILSKFLRLICCLFIFLERFFYTNPYHALLFLLFALFASFLLDRIGKVQNWSGIFFNSHISVLLILES